MMTRFPEPSARAARRTPSRRTPMPRAALAVGTLVCAVVGAFVGALVLPIDAAAQTPTAASAASGPAQTSAPAAALAVSLPADLARVTKEPADAQARWLRDEARAGKLAQLDDATLVALFTALDPRAVPDYIAAGPNGYPSYEFTMLRQERIRGVWARTPDHMRVKMTREPLRIYAKWLPDGAHAGQEVIYDATTRADEMYGHLGGLLGAIPMWLALDGVIARAQSNHVVRDLGTEYIAHLYVSESKKYDAAGVGRPTHVAVETIDGVRVVALTYETPTGRPQFYAKKETLGLDLRHPYFRTVESYGNDGQIFERIVFQTIEPMSFDDSVFDPKNPNYKF